MQKLSVPPPRYVIAGPVRVNRTANGDDFFRIIHFLVFLAGFESSYDGTHKKEIQRLAGI